MPAVNVVVFALMRRMAMPLPASQVSALVALLMFLAFFIGALGEELGWSGYVLDPLQERLNALQSSGILGVVGVVWHLVPLLLIHRSPTPGALPDQYNGRLRAAARSAADAGQP